MSIFLPIIILTNLALGVWLAGQLGMGPRGRRELMTVLNSFGRSSGSDKGKSDAEAAPTQSE